MKRLSCFLFCFSAFLLADLLLPQQALAWGPGAHMAAGNWILQNLSALSGTAVAALMHYPGQFLYGAPSANIFIGKGSKAKKGHNHNLESGFTLLTNAKDLSKLSYAYGYLVHLAADTVALADKAKDKKWTPAELHILIPPVLENIPPACTL